ncbi:phosphate ABC transporter substrate-binding protein [Anaerosalibacter bizertensis]|uniref:phosphate ABC transporter substrate-binding protein n=1 Tax=Anaerosalibacter bizertensis TaxID=932217 RepID=UPI001D009587|nr:phosphate ABC transporter substrate-binding protein [Anaerosalibacter bizertensis]MCB5559152.1 phosphate ABC transporter substrate-binding protein [Anaerosalibacter bizertensis]MCG4584262.1 phosphate ABC transporter substrate-binding protein [Anaerosalibacter bizertensis]
MKIASFKRIVLILSLVLIVSVVVAGCTKGSKEAKGTDSKLEGTINIVGSTSVTPLAEELGQEFSNKNPEIKVDIQGVGSTAGIKATIDKTADIGISSRDLKDEEKEYKMNEYIIAYDGIVVAVHPENSVEDLDMNTINKIFTGEIKNWKEVGGEDEEILIISREEGSGTRGAFEEILDLDSVREDALIAEGNGAVKANIASKKNSIGYISLSYLDDSIKGLKIDGIEGTVENIKSGKYKVSRPFLMLTNGKEEPLVKEFLDFVLSEEGQKIVGEKQITVK